MSLCWPKLVVTCIYWAAIIFGTKECIKISNIKKNKNNKNLQITFCMFYLVRINIAYQNLP